MVKINAAVGHVIDWICRVVEVALLVEHLGDTLRRGGGHRNHDKDHRQHHKAHENLHGVGNHAGQRADAEVRPVGADDEPRRKVADQDAADGNAEQHQRIVERQKLFRLQEVLAHIVGGRRKLFRLIILTDKALDDAHRLHVLLHGIVQPVVLLEHGAEKRHGRPDHHGEAEAENGNDGREYERQLLADADGHDDRKNQHQRCAHRRANEHHVGVLNV